MHRAARSVAGEDIAEFRITDFPLHYLVYISRQAQTAFARTLRPHGLNNQTWRVLAALSTSEGLTIGQIAELTVFDRSNLGRLIDAMEREGLVARTPDATDRRAVLVRMTGAGRARFDAARVQVLAIYDRLFDGFGADEREGLMRGLRRMKANSAMLSEAT